MTDLTHGVVRALTPPGPGGVAVVRVGGPGREPALRRVGVLRPAPPGSLRLVRLRDPQDPPDAPPLDEALLVGLEDAVELHLHGSPPLVRRVLDLLDPGPRSTPPALPDALDPQEHGRRAAELVADAPSRLGARLLLDQSEGALERELETARDLDPSGRARVLAELEARAAVARALLHPARVLLAGPVNAGKSTLFNALVGEEHALTSDEPGTTRDALLRRVHLGPWPVDLVDTAGERELAPGAGPAARVERAGQELARRLRTDAALVLWLRPLDARGVPQGDPAPAGSQELLTQGDRCPGSVPAQAVSALADPQGARDALRTLLERVLGLAGAEPWVAGRGVPFDGPSLDHVRRTLGGPR